MGFAPGSKPPPSAPRTSPGSSFKRRFSFDFFLSKCPVSFVSGFGLTISFLKCSKVPRKTHFLIFQTVTTTLSNFASYPAQPANADAFEGTASGEGFEAESWPPATAPSAAAGNSGCLVPSKRFKTSKMF